MTHILRIHGTEIIPSSNVRILSSKILNWGCQDIMLFYGMGFDAYRQEVLSITKEAKYFGVYKYMSVSWNGGHAFLTTAIQRLIQIGFLKWDLVYALSHFHKYDGPFRTKEL